MIWRENRTLGRSSSRLAGVLGIVTAAATCLASPEADAPHRVLVRATVAPGKPGAPRESVEVTKRGKTHAIRVTRVDTEGRILADQRVAITPDDFGAIWRIVAARELDRFEPNTVDDPEPDFGEIRLRVETATDDTAAARVHERAWDRSLDNQDQVRPLLLALADLAARAVPEVKLHYVR